MLNTEYALANAEITCEVIRMLEALDEDEIDISDFSLENQALLVDSLMIVQQLYTNLSVLESRGVI